MPRRFPHDDRPHEQRVASPDVTRVLFMAFGIAALIGLVTGVLWIAWTLFRLHVLQ